LTKQKKEICPTCGKSFVYLNRHKCKNSEKGLSGKKKIKKNKNSIKKLNLKWRNIHSITNISKIKELPDLQELNLEGNYIKSIHGLDHLVKLKKLNLSINGISEIKGLDKHIDLEVLKISTPQQYYEANSMMGHAGPWDREYFEPIRTIEGLEKLANLKILDLSRNEISKIEGLENQKKLEKLFLYGNKITDIQGLKHLTNLRELSLKGNPVKIIDHTVVKNLKELKKCDLPILSFLKKVNLTEYLTVKLFKNDLSRYGEYNGYGWDFYDKYTTANLSSLLAIIYVRSEKFNRTCSTNKSRRITGGGLALKSEKEFIRYCNKIQTWTKREYLSKTFPKSMTTPLLELLSKAGDPLAKKAIGS
jgi:hypothetical protein